MYFILFTNVKSYHSKEEAHLLTKHLPTIHLLKLRPGRLVDWASDDLGSPTTLPRTGGTPRAGQRTKSRQHLLLDWLAD